MMSLPMRRLKDKLASHEKNALVQKCVAPPCSASHAS